MRPSCVPRGENNPAAFAGEKSVVHGARGALQRAFGKASKNRPCRARSANLVSPPPGKDVALTCRPGDIGPVSTRVPGRCVLPLLLVVAPLLPPAPPYPLKSRVNRINPVDGRGGRRGRTSIRTNLSATVISLGGCSPWVRGKFICLLPLIEGDANAGLQLRDGKTGESARGNRR